MFQKLVPPGLANQVNRRFTSLKKAQSFNLAEATVQQFSISPKISNGSFCEPCRSVVDIIDGQLPYCPAACSGEVSRCELHEQQFAYPAMPSCILRRTISALASTGGL